MPLFYNQGAPSAGSSNSITATATNLGIRDFLLTKNIQNPIKYPWLSTSRNGSPRGGQPVLDTMVGNGSVPTQVPVTITGLAYYANNISNNLFKDTDPMAPLILNVNDVTKIPIFPEPAVGSVNYAQEDLTQYGILPKSDFLNFRENATLINLYLDTSKQIDMADYISLQPLLISSQIKGGYLDEYGDLNLGQSGAVHAADVIGSALNGGLGIGGATNFDIRSSLAGRVLTAAGILNDSKLGVIGGQQLALALANNAAFNIEKQALGALNIEGNVVSLIKGNGFAPAMQDYTITVPSSTGGKILSYAEKILGFVVPHSYLQPEGSIFTSENGGIVSNIERANSMLLNPGNGQISALKTQFNATLFGSGGSGYDSPTNSPFRSGYMPGYVDHSNNQLFVPVGYAFMSQDKGLITNFVGSISSSNPIPQISWNREKMVETYGFIDTENKYYNVLNANNGGSSAFRTKFAWTTKNGEAVNITSIDSQYDGQDLMGDLNSNVTKKSLLFKTQKLFNSEGMKTLVSVKGDSVSNRTQIQSAVSPNNLISKGSGVMQGSKFNPDGTFNFGKNDNAENTFCRVWTPYNRYDSVGKMIRHRGLDQQEGSGASFFNSGGKVSSWRVNSLGSVLDDTSNGFVKIGPYKNDSKETDDGRNKTSPKKYMFSIENLAWGDSESQLNLLPEEKGPGDLLTGTYGRIMWFPPYDINFTETSSLNIESTNFIGRGEPIYTYNNTERIGNLSFKIVVDHPSVMNAFGGDTTVKDEFIDSFVAGCTDLDSNWLDKLTGADRNKVEVVNQLPVEQKKIDIVKAPDNFKIYFPNDVTTIDTILSLEYELNPIGSRLIPYSGEPQNEGPGIGIKTNNYIDTFSYGLNSQSIGINGKVYSSLSGPTWNDNTYKNDLQTYFLVTCQTCKATVNGSASNQQIYSPANVLLAQNRANNIRNFLIDEIGLPANRVVIGVATPSTSTSYSNKTPISALNVKEDRYGSVEFDSNQDKTNTSNDKTVYKKITTNNLNSSIKRKFYTEVNFFDQLKETDPFIFDKIRDKIKYFHPAFHSTTPEGLNSRLTFLLQCTRQGKTGLNGDPSNLAFGRQPVCILRIGDFYNTKIMMDNVSFSFEPLVWDLNPEGIGVQPMIANVNISFKFIGASSLYGPINKLQNALSFNYFANSQVYDPRADYISNKGGDTSTSKDYRLNLGLSAISNTYLTSTPIVDPTSTSDVNQIATADNLPVPSPSNMPIDNTPKLIGIDSIKISNTTVKSFYIICVVLKQLNIFGITDSTLTQLISDQDLTNFVGKGVSVSIEAYPTPSVLDRFEILLNDNKALSNAVTIGVYMGSPTADYATGEIMLSDGNYMVTLKYSGNVIQRVPITLPQTN